MKSFERKRNSSQVVIERPKLRPRSRCGKMEVPEKKIEGFSKLSEILAGAQGAIFELVESGREGLEAKTRLWEIFSYLNNKIWKEVYRPGSSSGENNELEIVRSQLVEANLQVKDLKFRLQDFESIERKQDFFGVQSELKKYKDENKKLLNELSETSKEYLSREGKINELAKLNNQLRQEISDFKMRESQRDRAEVGFGLEKVNVEYWSEQVSYYKENFEQLQEGTLELQEKFMNKCKAYEDLMKQNKEFQDLLKKKHVKTKSVCRSNSRSSSYLPKGGIIKTKKKSRDFEIIHCENFKVSSGCELRSEILMLKNSFEALKIDKNHLERINAREKVEKQEIFDQLKKFQLSCEEFNEKLTAKDKEIVELLEIQLKNTKEIQDLSSLLSERNERIDKLLKDCKESEKNLESANKKCTSLKKTLEACEKEKENWMNIQNDYLTQLEVLQTNSRHIVDKDSISSQNELKCAKSLIIRNQTEINKLKKEKEMLLQELNNVRHKKFENLNEEGEEKLKDLESHIMNLRSLLEVKEKIIKEYGIKQRISNNEDSIKGYIEKIQELEDSILKYKASVKEYQENLNRINKDLSISRLELKQEKEKLLFLEERAKQVEHEKQGLIDELEEKSKEKSFNDICIKQLKKENESQLNEIRMLKSSNSICEQMLNKMEKDNLEIRNEFLMKENLKSNSLAEERYEIDYKISEIIKNKETEKELIVKKLEQNIANYEKIAGEHEELKSLNAVLNCRIEVLISEIMDQKNIIFKLQTDNLELESCIKELNEQNTQLLSKETSFSTLINNLTQKYKDSSILLQEEKLDLENQVIDFKSQAEVTIKECKDQNLLLSENLLKMTIDKDFLFEENLKNSEKIKDLEIKLAQNLSEKNEEIKSLKDLQNYSESTNKILEIEVNLIKKELGSIIHLSNDDQIQDKKSQSQELLLKDLGATLDQLAEKIDKLTEEKALLQLESSEKSDDILKLNKELFMLKIEKQDLADSLSGGCSQRTAQFLNGEIRELEDRFKSYEQEIDSLVSENKLMGMIVEEKSDKLENMTQKFEKLNGYFRKAVKVLKETTMTNKAYEHRTMINSEVFELYKSEQINLVSKLKEVKKTIVLSRNTENTVLKENRITINT